MDSGMATGEAVLVLSNGVEFRGRSFGAMGTAVGEVVFNTGIVGYQRVLTDPSYCGQIVTMSYPLIGNVGINPHEHESERPWPKAYIAREFTEPSHYQSESALEPYLRSYGVVGIQAIDTRALVRILRENGTMNGVVSSDPGFRAAEWTDRISDYRAVDPVLEVTCKERHVHPPVGEKRFRVALLDYGCKSGIVRGLCERGCEVVQLPAGTSAAEVLALEPDGIMLSNGPGDPKDCTFQIDQLKRLIGVRPMFGICLGHQLMALATGADTAKLKFGHRGGNHPVKDLAHDRVYVTTQNHGYAVLRDTVDPKVAEISHISMNDESVEGLRYFGIPAFSVQFHPEAAPGPLDTAYLFDEFLATIPAVAR
jgi:carbamoyl-phosphate synthase small subunit